MRFLVLIYSCIQPFLTLVLAQDLIPYRSGNKWGYANPKGELVVETIYDSATPYTEGRARIELNSKFGFLDENGQIVIPIQYDLADEYQFHRAQVRIGEENYCIDQFGQPADCITGCGGPFTGEVFFAMNLGREAGKLVIYQNRWNNMPDGTFQHTIDTVRTDWVDLIENGYGFAAVRKGARWAMVNQNLELISPFKYESVDMPSLTHLQYMRVRKKGKYGFLYRNGLEMTALKYTKVEHFTRHGVAKVWLDKDFWGYIDKNGKEYFNR
jgi:hypothetical protein